MHDQMHPKELIGASAESVGYSPHIAVRLHPSGCEFSTTSRSFTLSLPIIVNRRTMAVRSGNQPLKVRFRNSWLTDVPVIFSRQDTER